MVSTRVLATVDGVKVAHVMNSAEGFVKGFSNPKHVERYVLELLFRNLGFGTVPANGFGFTEMKNSYDPYLFTDLAINDEGIYGITIDEAKAGVVFRNGKTYKLLDYYEQKEIDAQVKKLEAPATIVVAPKQNATADSALSKAIKLVDDIMPMYKKYISITPLDLAKKVAAKDFTGVIDAIDIQALVADIIKSTNLARTIPVETLEASIPGYVEMAKNVLIDKLNGKDVDIAQSIESAIAEPEPKKDTIQSMKDKYLEKRIKEIFDELSFEYGIYMNEQDEKIMGMIKSYDLNGIINTVDFRSLLLDKAKAEGATIPDEVLDGFVETNRNSFREKVDEAFTKLKSDLAEIESGNMLKPAMAALTGNMVAPIVPATIGQISMNNDVFNKYPDIGFLKEIENKAKRDKKGLMVKLNEIGNRMFECIVFDKAVEHRDKSVILDFGGNLNPKLALETWCPLEDKSKVAIFNPGDVYKFIFSRSQSSGK